MKIRFQLLDAISIPWGTIVILIEMGFRAEEPNVADRAGGDL